MIKSGSTPNPGRSLPMSPRCGMRPDWITPQLTDLSKHQMLQTWTTPRDGAETLGSAVFSMMIPRPSCTLVSLPLSTSSQHSRTPQVKLQWLSTSPTGKNGQKFQEVSFQTLTSILDSLQEHGPNQLPQEEPSGLRE